MRKIQSKCASYTLFLTSRSRRASGVLLSVQKHYNNTLSGYHTQLAKMSFDEIFDFTAGVYLFILKEHVACKDEF